MGVIRESNRETHRETNVVAPPEQDRVAITLTVADGFKFGCGLILAGAAFYFALIIVIATAFLFAMVLNLPLPFGLSGGR